MRITLSLQTDLNVKNLHMVSGNLSVRLLLGRKQELVDKLGKWTLQIQSKSLNNDYLVSQVYCFSPKNLKEFSHGCPVSGCSYLCCTASRFLLPPFSNFRLFA